MGIDLYFSPISAYCRAVQLTAKNIGIEVNIVNVDLFAGDQKKPEFLKMNPQHQVPTIDDNGFYLCESRAIMQYLANAYAQDDGFYPKVTKKRAIVDQRLMFDTGTLYKTFADAYYPAIFQGQAIEPEKITILDDSLNYLEGFLQKTKYVAGLTLTIADFAIMASLCTIGAVGHSLLAFPTVMEYMDVCKDEMKGSQENEDGAAMFGDYAKAKLNKE